MRVKDRLFRQDKSLDFGVFNFAEFIASFHFYSTLFLSGVTVRYRMILNEINFVNLT